LTVRTDEPFVSTGGEKLADIPSGRFEAERLICAENPWTAVTVVENCALLPNATVCAAGDSPSVNAAGGFPTQFRMDLFTFNRPPVTETPARLGSGSTESSMLALSAAVFNPQADKIRAAAPDTMAAEAEVPV
jgi:hypothetical protein